MTKTRRKKAEQVRRMRADNHPWAEVVEAVGVSESTARKLLKELEPVQTPKQPTNEPPKPRSGRYLKMICPCMHIVRTSKTAAEAGLTCGACKKPFVEAA